MKKIAYQNEKKVTTVKNLERDKIESSIIGQIQDKLSKTISFFKFCDIKIKLARSATAENYAALLAIMYHLLQCAIKITLTYLFHVDLTKIARHILLLFYMTSKFSLSDELNIEKLVKK